MAIAKRTAQRQSDKRCRAVALATNPSDAGWVSLFSCVSCCKLLFVAALRGNTSLDRSCAGAAGPAEDCNGQEPASAARFRSAGQCPRTLCPIADLTLEGLCLAEVCAIAVAHLKQAHSVGGDASCDRAHASSPHEDPFVCEAPNNTPGSIGGTDAMVRPIETIGFFGSFRFCFVRVEAYCVRRLCTLGSTERTRRCCISRRRKYLYAP